MTHAVTALRWLVFVVVALAMNVPVIVTLVTSLKTPGEISMNPSLWIDAPTLSNYARVFEIADRFDAAGFLLNSLVASTFGAVAAIVLALPAAYAMARHGDGRRLLLPAILNLRAVPLIIFAIPIYMMYQWLGLLDTRIGLGLILTIVNLPLALIMLVNAIDAVPAELDEAARIDGAGLWTVLTRVTAPMCRAALAATLIFGFITAWNEFLFGLMLTTRSAVPMTVGASFFFAASGGGVDWGIAAAVMIIGALPPTLLGLLMYRQIGRSLTSGAVKG
ncbi:MAG: carbohydrate ABC transporter permease [Alphaproteobacteria bacterium]